MIQTFQGRNIPDLYDLYDTAHVAEWELHDLHDLAPVFFPVFDLYSANPAQYTSGIYGLR